MENQTNLRAVLAALCVPVDKSPTACAEFQVIKERGAASTLADVAAKYSSSVLGQID
jgi:hypothetical protein